MSAPFSIAVLSPTPTWPNDFGNRKRIRRMCEGLRDRGARIDFFLYALEDDWRGRYPRHALEEMRDQWDDVHIIVPTVPYHPPPRHGADHLIDEWWDPAIDAYLGWYLHARRPDALLVNYAYLSKALELAPPSCLRILDTHDRMGGRRDVLQGLGLQPEFFYTTPHEEAKALDRADLVLAIKEEEAEYFSSISTTPALPVQYVEADRAVAGDLDGEGYLRVGLLGARNNVNVASTSRFLDTALPLFSESMAPVKVVLAGSMCQDLDAYGSDDRVQMLGFVDEVSDFYENVDVAVVPIERSTGQKIRVGEALGYGVPLIAHRHAFEGYPPSHRYHRLPDIDAIARACITLAFEPSLLPDLRAATQTSQSSATRRESLAIDVLADTVQGHMPVSYFLVPDDRLRSEPELRLHIASVVTLAASYSRVRVVLTGAHPDGCADRAVEALFEFLRRFGAILVQGSGSEDASPYCDGVLADIMEALRAPVAVNAWCYDASLLADLADIECDVFVADGMATHPDHSDGIQGYLGATEGGVCCGRVGLDEGAACLRDPWAYGIALFSPWVASQMSEMRDVRHRDRALVLADPADQPMAWLALAVLRAEGLEATLVIPDGQEPPAADLLGATRTGVSPSVFTTSEAREWLRSNAPKLTFDCAPLSPQISVLAAMARLHARRGHGSAPWKARSVPVSSGLPSVIRSMRDYVRAAPFVDRDEDGSVQFHNRQSERLLPQSITIPSL